MLSDGPAAPVAPPSAAPFGLAPLERPLLSPPPAAPADEAPPLPISSPFAPLAVNSPPPVTRALGHASRSSGASLPLPVRAALERLLNTSFAEVEVHTDESAAAATASVGAAAMTIGHRVFFAPGRFRPEEAEGSALLAHELTHVVQQRVAPMQMALKSLAPAFASPAEAEAERTETQILDLHRGGAFPAQPLTLARTPAASTPAHENGWAPDGLALGTDAAPAFARVTTIQREPDSPNGTTPSTTATGAAARTPDEDEEETRKLADRVFYHIFERLKDRLTIDRERRGHWL